MATKRSSRSSFSADVASLPAPTTAAVSSPQSQSPPKPLLIKMASGPLTAHAFRLTPGQELVPCLMEAAAQACLLSGATACHMLTAVGSLSRVTLRLASATATSTRTTASSGSSGSNPLRTWTEPVEVTSLVGTMTAAGDGGKHWHMSIADAAGNSFGGHVMEATVWTTMEIVLGTIGNGVSFSREMDTATGYRELVVRQGQRQEQEQQQGREENEEHEDEDVEEQIAAIRREARRGKRKRR